MKEECPVYNLSFMRDQTQDNKIRTIRPLKATHAIGKGGVDDWGATEGRGPVGTRNNLSRGRLAILEAPTI